MVDYTRIYWYKGYGATFLTDKAQDKFVYSCFQYQTPIPMLYNHQGCIVGYVVMTREDHKGLFITFFTYQPIKYDYLSIGFKILKVNNLWYRKFFSVEIIEFSIVSNPAQLGTEIYAIS